MRSMVGIWLVACALAACSFADEETSTSDQAVTTTNGVWQNGLTSNGVWQNGVWQNGVWQNGVWQNGVWQNGVWQNGVWQNGVWQNGITQNGVWQNGVWQNGVWQNGVWQNGVWQNGVWQNGVWQNGLYTPGMWEEPARHDLLANNPYTAKVLQYIYSCAMPADAHKLLDAGGGVTVQLDGAIGLAPTWDTEGGTCDESCQRWVSACVLARTNAYGVHVNISMRVSSSAPAAIQQALALGPNEANDYPNREGTYFGNLFQTTPVDNTGAAVPPGPPNTTADEIVSTPQLYACAGPESNVPDLTKRFCSSQGDKGPIEVLGDCEPVGGRTPVCSGIDGSGAEVSCYGPAPASVTTGELRKYDEVITVYLADPIATCGDGLCEPGEDDPTKDIACPADCHPGTWGKALDVNPGWETANGTDLGGSRSAATSDGGVVIGGAAMGTFNFGGAVITTDDVPKVMLAKYSSTGAYVWSTAIARLVRTDDSSGGGLAVAPNGAVALVGHSTDDLATGVWVGRFDPDPADPQGAAPHIASSITFGGTSAVTPTGPPVFDSAGNLYVAGFYRGPGPFGNHVVLTDPGGNVDVFVVKIAPDGDIPWAKDLGEGHTEGLAVDPRNGDVVVAYRSALVKLDGITGTEQWRMAGEWYAAAIDATGNVYASSGHSAAALYKFDHAGRELGHTAGATIVCEDGVSSCTVDLAGSHVVLDNHGSVIVVSSGAGEPRGFDFGAGLFIPYATPDTYIAGYDAATLGFRWARHIPMVLDGSSRGFSLDSTGKIVMTGQFSGSMVADDKFLVTNDPEDRTHSNIYMAAFNTPSLDDVIAPTLTNMPGHIIVEQTTAAGTAVWFPIPTAVDNGRAGTNVVCDHAPNEVYPYGDTTVTCQAHDPLDNTSADQTFTISVRDTQGPLFKTMPPLPSVAATGPGTVVTFALPVAFDNLTASNTAVTCDHASGATYPVGATDVICSSVDAHGNRSYATLRVVVVDLTPPSLTVPSALTVTATSSSGAVVTFSTSATDAVDGPVAVTCTPPSGSVFAPGSRIVTCTAHDAAGNSVSRTFTVNVVFSWAMFLQPINTDGSSIFKQGSTIPVKFASALGTLAPQIRVQRLSNNVTGSDLEVFSSGNADSGTTFRYDPVGGIYIFNLATATLLPGTYQIGANLGDGVWHVVNISIKK